MIYRVSSAHEEGGDRVLRRVHRASSSATTTARVRALRLVEVEIDATAEFVSRCAGTEREIPRDLVLLAMGFTGAGARTACSTISASSSTRAATSPATASYADHGARRVRRRRHRPRPVADRLGDRRGPCAAAAVDAYLTGATTACRSRWPSTAARSLPRRRAARRRRPDAICTPSSGPRPRYAEGMCHEPPRQDRLHARARRPSTEERISALVDAGHGRRPAEPQPRQPRRPRARLPARPRRRPTRPAARVGILADLQGPKIRLGRFADGPVLLAAGDEFTHHHRRHPRRPRTRRPPPTRACPTTSRPGDRILIDDGNVALDGRPTSTAPEVRHHGHRGRRGLRPQGHQPAGRRGQRARAVRQGRSTTCAGRCGSASTSSRCPSSASPTTSSACTRSWTRTAVRVPVIAKIEKPQAVDDLEEIVDAFDGIMVARGDLGVELPLEQVPAGAEAGDRSWPGEHAKPVIVATQMLESMISALAARPAPRPPTSPTRCSTAPTR